MNQKLRDFLDSNKVYYETFRHKPTMDASRTAQVTRVPGREFAKTVIVKADDKRVMTVLPAPDQVHLEQLQQALGAQNVQLASEADIRDVFTDCELGAMPPFGNLYDMDVVVSQALTDDENIVFHAGNHEEVVQMKYEDYNRLVQPKVIRF